MIPFPFHCFTRPLPVPPGFTLTFFPADFLINRQLYLFGVLVPNN